MIIDHIGIKVSDLARSKDFYTAALAPLGIGVILDFGQWVGLGKVGKPDFWLGADAGAVSSTVHVAFRVDSRAHVRAFYEAALKAGGRDNGAPGVREMYHPNYYGAFVLCPDGHNIEAVCHLPPSDTNT